MSDIIRLDYYRQIKNVIAVKANDNKPNPFRVLYWTNDHHEISIEISEGQMVTKEHPNPRGN